MLFLSHICDIRKYFITHLCKYQSFSFILWNFHWQIAIFCNILCLSFDMVLKNQIMTLHIMSYLENPLSWVWSLVLTRSAKQNRADFRKYISPPQWAHWYLYKTKFWKCHSVVTYILKESYITPPCGCYLLPTERKYCRQD